MNANAQYDAFAADYTAAEEGKNRLSFRQGIVFPSYLNAVGSVRGKSVLDVGCGYGTYTRMFRRDGATHVVGVDISPEMIARARAHDTTEPGAIEFRVHAAEEMPVLGQFDLISAAFLLPYAKDLDELRRMCERMAANAAPCGRIALIVDDSHYHPGLPIPQGCGLAIRVPVSPFDGDTIELDVGDPPACTIRYRYWRRESYEHALRTAGFTCVQWHPLAWNNTAQPDPPEAFATYLRNPHIAVLTATKEKAGGPPEAKGSSESARSSDRSEVIA
ncbi:class I SAM-dependent methyltransferase [Streptomyces sp. NPDC002659]|uniref:class I SAM-dependent methyltransferase n=1 Tax=Streptomyces sp. NPDC002659 TaxID=3364656 RepID=UPI00369508CA